MLSTNTINETTILLEKDSAPKCFLKKECFAKKGCLVIFAVVCGLAIVFAVLMIKWYLISQSVITPTVSHDAEFYPNAKPPSLEEFESGVNSNGNEKQIDGDGPPAFGSFGKVVAQMPPPPPPSSDRVEQVTKEKQTSENSFIFCFGFVLREQSWSNHNK